MPELKVEEVAKVKSEFWLTVYPYFLLSTESHYTGYAGLS
jgi:hypothetical protein